jgi:hypothetical protein
MQVKDKSYHVERDRIEMNSVVKNGSMSVYDNFMSVKAKVETK